MKNLNVLSSVVSFMAFWNFFFEHLCSAEIIGVHKHSFKLRISIEK
jgi:hypothetical protein